MKVAGTVALVTGGASGLGLATVKELLAGGGKVMIVDRPQSDGAAVAKELGASTGFAAADVTSEAEVKAAVEQTMKQFGAIHVNVNCAGTGAAMKTTGKAGPMPLEIFAKVIEINLVGTFNVLRLCATEMMKNAPNEDGERA
jgi:NAD(P)-dependent dehydrogenase (short-subunit alcohol dehydrogenase family)